MARRASAFADEVGTRTNITPLFAYDGAPCLPPLPPPHVASVSHAPPPRPRMASEIVPRGTTMGSVRPCAAVEEVTAPLARDRRWESESEDPTDVDVDVVEDATTQMPAIASVHGRWSRTPSSF